MDRKDLPNIGEPGTAADFQLATLREWGLNELADGCTSHEQAALVHHCALYVRAVWKDLHGQTAEPPVQAVRQCIEKMSAQPEILQRAERFATHALAADDRPITVTDDEILYTAVKGDLVTFPNPD